MLKSHDDGVCRYVSSIEACWRLLGHDVHEQWPPVMRLPVHLENQQEVEYEPDNENIAQVLQRAGRTPLTAWFDACKRNEPADKRFHDGKTANDFHYNQAPEAFVYHWRDRQWRTRVKGFQIGRMHMTNPCELLLLLD